jgi:hypothetical protein
MKNMCRRYSAKKGGIEVENGKFFWKISRYPPSTANREVYSNRGKANDEFRNE